MDQRYVEELTAALYRVTDRMDDREPLKWRLRERSLGFERLFVENPDLVKLGEEDARTKNLMFHIEEVVRMLQLCSSLYVISKINFDMLINGYERFRSIGTRDTLSAADVEESEQKKSVPVQEPSGRQKQIVDILQGLDSASIKDLAGYFKGAVSEKTLQRDLNDLISSGYVDTAGKRRWRRYKVLRT